MLRVSNRQKEVLAEKGFEPVNFSFLYVAKGRTNGKKAVVNHELSHNFYSKTCCDERRY